MRVLTRIRPQERMKGLALVGAIFRGSVQTGVRSHWISSRRDTEGPM